MTGTGQNGSPQVMRESARIGLNLVALLSSRFFCLALSLVQAGIIFRALGVGGSGQFGFALNYPALFTVFATLGIHRLLIRDIARDPAVAWTYVWTAASITSVLSLLVTGAIMGSLAFIEPDPMVRRAVFMSTLSVIVVWAVQRPFESLLMARERMVSIAVINAISGLARLLGVFYALRFAATSASAHGGIAVGNLIGLVLCVAAARRLVPSEGGRFDLAHALFQVRESMPFSVAALFSMVYFKADMSLLKWLAGDDAAGIYTVPQRVMEPLLMIAAIWGTAIFPALCRHSVSSPERHDRLMRSSARLALLIAFPMAFGIAALAEPIVGLLTGHRAAEFAGAVRVLRILCAVTPFFYLNGVGQEFLYSRHQNWFVSSSYALASLLSIGGNLLLIPVWGTIGVASVSLVTNVSISILFVRKMRTDYGTMNLGALIAKTLVVCVVMGTVSYALSNTSLVLAVMAGAIVYAVGIVLVGVFNEDERSLLAGLLRRR